MEQKLSANKDHFDFSQLRIAYMASWCEGHAQWHITPRLWSDSSTPYVDSSNILDHLKVVYNDPNQVTSAKNAFRALRMKSMDKYHDFLSEFAYLTVESEENEEEWSEELYLCLTSELQKMTMMELLKPNIIFEEYSNFVSQIASCLDMIHQQNPQNCFSNTIFFFY